MLLCLLFHLVPSNVTWDKCSHLCLLERGGWRGRGWDWPFACGLKFLLPPAGLPTAAGVFGIAPSPLSPSLDFIQEWATGEKIQKNPKIVLSTVLRKVGWGKQLMQFIILILLHHGVGSGPGSFPGAGGALGRRVGLSPRALTWHTPICSPD